MKKYLLSALALPLLFACSSEDYLDQKATDNDQFAGIEKVDATFSMDEGTTTRFDGGVWNTEEGDLWGFAWMGDGTVVTVDGKAKQNHNLIQTDGIFKPQTSIYVGKYYLYRPYDVETVSPQAINFKSLEEQPLAEGYESAKQPWKDLAKTAINIGDKFTEVTPTGTPDDDDEEFIWDKAGIKQNYHIYGAVFSNQTGLDLTYQKNNVSFAAEQKVAGATDIDYTIAAGTKVGAADIYGATVTLTGAAKSFTYAPTTEPNGGVHKGTFWADKENLNGNAIGGTNAFEWTNGAITLKAADENGVSTDKADNKGWFWFNSLPVSEGNGNEETVVTTVLETSYGNVTVAKPVKDCAYAGNVESKVMVWHPLANAADDTKTPTVWAVAGTDAGKETFINQYGNHKGKYALTVDFSTGTLNGMHIKNDAYLQKVLKYYIAAGKTETAVLNLDGASATDKTFKLSKISIALLQTINATEKKVTVKPCSTHDTPKVIVTQDGQAELGLADATEVPSLKWVFNGGLDVYLSSECKWTWSGGEKGKTAVTTDGFIKSIINEGTLTVNATNVQASYDGTALKNAAGATMNITKVTTVKNALTNLGTINVGSASNTSAELRAYGVEIMNDATDLDKCGVINNYGVVGVTDGTSGEFNNYGLIEMKNGDAITLLTSNATSDDAFASAFNPTSNKMGTVVLPENNPTAMVSVNNEDANGFIKYNWNETTYTHNSGNVKYNTIVVSKDITFTGKAEEEATEVQYIEFNGTRTKVVNPSTANKLTALKGIIVNAGKSIIIEKGNKLNPLNGTFLGAGATVYNGGMFTHNAAVTGTTASNYFGDWQTTQIVKY